MTTSSAIFIAAACIFALALFILVAFFIRRHRRSLGTMECINEQVYVGNLPYQMTEDDLLSYFSSFGTTQSVRIIRHFKTGRSKGYAFVTYANSNEANSALSAHGKEFQGRTLVVRIAKPRQI